MNWIPLLRLLPRNAISQAFGVIARCKLPVFAPAFRDWFVRRFNIDMSDATRAQSEYVNVADLFIRELKPGARPLAVTEIVSPVDGRLSQYGELKDSNLKMIQAKGREYSLTTLLRDPVLAQKFVGGAYAVIYLAPFNYHRIHTPVAGQVVAALYHPGTLWPVNVSSVTQIDELFCVNERLTSHIKVQGGGECLVVKVGATNVGRISLAYTNEIVTNSAQTPSRSNPISIWKPDAPIELQKGDQLGAFELGSTVVMVFSAEVMARNPSALQAYVGKDVRMGQSLG